MWNTEGELRQKYEADNYFNQLVSGHTSPRVSSGLPQPSTKIHLASRGQAKDL